MARVAYRISERNFIAPPKVDPEPDRLDLHARGESACLNERGEPLAVRVVDDTGAGLPRPIATRASREPGAARARVTTPTADAAADGRAFARAGMTPARLERLEARAQHAAAAAPSTHPDRATADGQDFARAHMTPAQRERLEARDRARARG